MVAVDPSSPFTGGALLGDRVRMNRHATDDGVFIRSLATRGHHGGLSRATSATVAVLDAAGFPVIFVETVGAGQAEVEVADAADAVVVVTAPGLGDEVQALKAGLLEIADLLVVNKGDRDGADRTLADLTAMLALAARPVPPLMQDRRVDGGGGRRAGGRARASARPPSGRARGPPPPAGRAADRGHRRRARAGAGGGGARRPESRRRRRGPPTLHLLTSTVDAVAARTLDPWSAADQLLEVLK